MDSLAYFLFFLVGAILFGFSMAFKDYPTGLFAGLTILTLGVVILINPVTDISSLANLALGFVMAGFGGYVFIRASIEYYQELF